MARRPLPTEQLLQPNGGSHHGEDHERRTKASDPAYEQGLWEGLIEVRATAIATDYSFRLSSVLSVTYCHLQYEATRRKLRIVLGQVPSEHCRLLNLTTPLAADFVGQRSAWPRLSSFVVACYCLSLLVSIARASLPRRVAWGICQSLFETHAWHAPSSDLSAECRTDQQRPGLKTIRIDTSHYVPVCGMGTLLTTTVSRAGGVANNCCARI